MNEETRSQEIKTQSKISRPIRKALHYFFGAFLTLAFIAVVAFFFASGYACAMSVMFDKMNDTATFCIKNFGLSIVALIAFIIPFALTEQPD